MRTLSLWVWVCLGFRELSVLCRASEGGTEAFSQNHAVRSKNSLEGGVDARLFGESVL